MKYLLTTFAFLFQAVQYAAAQELGGGVKEGSCIPVEEFATF